MLAVGSNVVCVGAMLYVSVGNILGVEVVGVLFVRVFAVNCWTGLSWICRGWSTGLSRLWMMVSELLELRMLVSLTGSCCRGWSC